MQSAPMAMRRAVTAPSRPVAARTNPVVRAPDMSAGPTAYAASQANNSDNPITGFLRGMVDASAYREEQAAEQGKRSQVAEALKAHPDLARYVENEIMPAADAVRIAGDRDKVAAEATAAEQRRGEISQRLGELGYSDLQRLYDSKLIDEDGVQREILAMDEEKAPIIVEIYDPETGQPQKGYMEGDTFVPLGGSKSPSGGTNLTVDPTTGAITFSQGGTGQPGAAYDPTRDPGQLAKKLSEADVKAIEGYREAAVVADDLGATIDGLEMTIGNVGYTGPGGELYGTLDDVVGVLPGDSGSRGAAKSLAMEAQLAMTAKTKGAITDREMGMFRQAVPGLGQTKDGNTQIIAAMRAMTNRVKTRASFMEEYASANGSLNGAQDAWRRYIEENPVLTSDADGLVVNEEADFAPYLDDDGGNAEGTGEAARPTSDEEYDALPSGALFIDPDDGKQYRKP
jgi:hypothetical protein